MVSSPLLSVGVGEAVRVVFPGAYVDFGGLAHEVVVVDALDALAGPDVGQYLGKSPVASGLNEGGAVCVVFPSADSDSSGIAVGVVIEGTVGHAAVGNMRCHFGILPASAPGWRSVVPT